MDRDGGGARGGNWSSGGALGVASLKGLSLRGSVSGMMFKRRNGEGRACLGRKRAG